MVRMTGAGPSGVRRLLLSCPAAASAGPPGRKQIEREQFLEKNQIFETVIEDMSENGEGIGKVDGYTLFIKDTVIGDRVQGKVIKAKKS